MKMPPMLETNYYQIRKKIVNSRKLPAKWLKKSVKNFFNPLCYETEETFLGRDHFYDRPAWRKIRIFKPFKKRHIHPIILVPPTGGLSAFDRVLSSRLAIEGYEVYALSAFEGWDDSSANLERHDRQSIQSMSALKELQRWLKRPHHVIGSSLGAMYSLQAYANDPLVKKIILIVGGEDFAGILTDSQLMIATRNKKDRMKSYHIKDDRQHYKFMQEHFYVDPGIFVHNERHSEKYLLFLSQTDKVVPTPYQERLAEHLPKAQIIEMKSGHVLTIARAYLFYQNEIIRFLNSKKNIAPNLQ